MSEQYSVQITAGAEQGLKELYEYVIANDGLAHAEKLLNNLVSLADSLSSNPLRGAVVKELAELGITEYRQLLFKSYRLIYRLQDNSVYIYLIVDGRRDMQAVLSRRLLMA